MSRMNMIRNLAKSSVAAGAVGAVTGGAGAYYSGQDMMAGVGYGAMMGAGARAGAPMMAKAAGTASLGMRGMQNRFTGSMMRNLQVPGMKTGVTGMAGARGMTRSMYKGFSGVGALGAGVAGGAAGLGYSTLGANQGLNTTYRNATLNQRLQYDKTKALQSSAIRLNETRMKKQIWQPGAY